MNKIIKSNEDLVEILIGVNSLFNASIESIRIKDENNEVIIIVMIALAHQKSKRSFKLVFNNVFEYSFFHKSDVSFGLIERYTFAKTEKGFYISFDPYDDSNQVSLEDQDYILSASVIGELDI